MQIQQLTDAQGASTRPGDLVRILDITLDPDMEDDDRDMIEFMIGAICEVDRIDPAGCLWVTMWWNNVEGVVTTSVALYPEQFQKVEKQEASVGR